MRPGVEAQAAFPRVHDQCNAAIPECGLKWDSATLAVAYGERRLPTPATVAGPVLMSSAVVLMLDIAYPQLSAYQMLLFMNLWRSTEIQKTLGKTIRASSRGEMSGSRLLLDVVMPSRDRPAFVHAVTDLLDEPEDVEMIDLTGESDGPETLQSTYISPHAVRQFVCGDAELWAGVVVGAAVRPASDSPKRA